MGAIASVVTVNTLSRLHDQPALVRAGGAWRIVTDEASAGLVALPLIPLAVALLRWSPPAPGRWLPFAATHLAGSLAFAAAHVAGFVALRRLLYGLHGAAYRFGGFGDFLYEYRKDVVAYAIGVALFAAVDALRRRPVAPPAAGAATPTLIEIADGARTLRTPPGEILAATSAGNYVEFRLADGRRPLQRSTLAEVEAQLAPHGFVRTHRSWLVNATRVREIAPTGSGDRRLTLDDGGEAPLSRRYEGALEKLRIKPSA